MNVQRLVPTDDRRMLTAGQPSTVHCLLSTVYCLLSTLSLLAFLLAGCSNAEAAPSAPAQPVVTVTPTPSLAVIPRPPLATEQAAAPVRLAIPVLDFSVVVAPMAWQVTQVAGERRAVWQVP